ncbi:MAG: 23S rRNA (guanosine(2251)-2'-O)-methyltransferase RlmB [Nitrospinae bacterium]|jgi:23S rRNA (guanosine2251-2'-O)-methyltransferase|nr:23S rRNA (guanosine(2251)-2'-O)-methyltransferase RlmB [Nitrospinota bacterium]MDA1110289.1 23S rRNA (guanosine(2251)-2'-O)-methyltransferase RlmB [Nitrospinota bacterium]
MEHKKPSMLYGINPIQEALKASKRHCHKIVVKEEASNPRIQALLALAKSLKVTIEELHHKEFQKKYGAYAHQSIIGYFSSKEPLNIKDLIQLAFKTTSTPTLVLLDGIQDPQNLGAIIRSAEVFGVQGVILPERRSASITETVAKCSAGAIEIIPVACVNNLVQTLEILKKEGFWAVGVDSSGEKPCYELQFDFPTVLVIGGEEKGIRPLLRKQCDFTVHIPMQGKLDSLNAAAASAVIFYEISRQKKKPLLPRQKTNS